MSFANNAATTFASGITNSATSLTVASGTGAVFPTLSGSQYFYCTLENVAGTLREIVKVTARSTDTFTIVRSQDGTSAQAFSTGDKVELRLVRANLTDFALLDEANTFTGANAYGTPASITLTNATGLPYSGLTGTVPTWNQNTTGTASNVTGIVSQANGGTGTTTGYYGFKNRIINGAMGIWQRGTTTGSVVGTTGPYMADRFYGYAGTGNITISQSSDVPSNFTYSCSMVGTGVSITQRIESKNCVDLAGATVTVSFWAKSTAGSDNLQVTLYTATAGVDNWGSQTSTANTVSASPAGTWTYYTTTFTNIPSTATNGVGIGIARGSNATSTTLVTGVQLEKGSTATSFDYRPYGTELALCQRYYQVYADSTNTYRRYCVNVDRQPWPWCPPMRTTPTTNTTYSGSGAQTFSLNGDSQTMGHIEAQYTSGGTGVVDIASATFTLSAEL